MSDIKWIKITTDIFDDEKIRLIDSLPENDAILVIWIKILTLAGKCNQDGYLLLGDHLPYTDEMLSTIFNRPINTIRLAIQTFLNFGMIEQVNDVTLQSVTCEKVTLHITNWGKHQNIEGMDKVREQTRLRVAKYRNLKQIGNKDVTLHNVTVTQQNKNKKENKKINNSDEFLLPDYVDSETWEAFIEMRDKIKKPMTVKAKQLAVKKLDKFKNDGDDPNEVLQQSIFNSWQGLFAVKNSTKAVPKRKLEVVL